MKLKDLTDEEAGRLYDKYCSKSRLGCDKCKYSVRIFCILLEPLETRCNYEDTCAEFKESISKENFYDLLNEEEDIEKYLNDTLSDDNLTLVEALDIISNIANTEGKEKLSNELNIKIMEIRDILLKGDRNG